MMKIVDELSLHKRCNDNCILEKIAVSLLVFLMEERTQMRGRYAVKAKKQFRVCPIQEDLRVNFFTLSKDLRIGRLLVGL